MKLKELYNEYLEALKKGDDERADFIWNEVIIPLLDEKNWFSEPGKIEYSADTWIEYDGEKFIFHDSSQAYEVGIAEWNEANLDPESLAHLGERL